MGDQTRLDFSIGIRIDLVSVWGSETTCFKCRDRNWFGFGVAASKLTWIIGGWKLTLIQCRDRKWLGLCVDLVYVGDRTRLDFSIGIKIDLGLVWGLEMTCFKCRDRNRFGFGVAASKLTWIVGGWKLTLIQCRNRKWLGFCVDLVYVGDRTRLDFSIGMKIDLVLVWRSEMTWF